MQLMSQDADLLTNVGLNVKCPNVSMFMVPPSTDQYRTTQ